MLFSKVFERFAARSPVSVMTRSLLEYALAADPLDALFLQHAEHQYTRDLTFSSLVDLVSLVVTGTHSSVHAAYRADEHDIAVSLTSVYNKLNGLETSLSAELLRFSSRQLEPVLKEIGGELPPLVPGYRVRILDGNHLAATEHRLDETRTSASAPLPGLALVVFDPSLMLVTDMIPCEDGHTQERALLDQVVSTVRPRDLWVADRNFCVQGFLLGIVRRSGCFAIREHKGLAWESVSCLRNRGRIEGSRVSEQRIKLVDGEGNQVFLRRVVLRLDKPTRDGETEVVILTNLPVQDADSRRVGILYRKRWLIETAFQELTEALSCEVRTLCYPRAALFVFSLACVAYNVMGVLKGSLRAVHGAEKAEKLSGYHLASEISGMKEGMLVAIPKEEWVVFRSMSLGELVKWLRALASQVRLSRFRSSPRGPKKPVSKRKYNKKHPHVSTAKLLAGRKKKNSADHEAKPTP